MWMQYLFVSAILNLAVLFASKVRIPLFITPLKALPQPLAKTKSFYHPSERDEFFSKVTAWDVWQGTNYSVLDLNDSSVFDILHKANFLYRNSSLETHELRVHMCGPYCYNVNLSDIEYYTGYKRSELTGQADPSFTLGHLHEAVVITLGKHFCFTMSDVEQQLGMSSFNVTSLQWKLFLPNIAWYAIQCRADILGVSRSEFSELVRTDEATILNYSLEQLDSNLISPYLTIIKSKAVFEDDEMDDYFQSDVYGSGSLSDWTSRPLYYYISAATNFTIRDLEILYGWNSTQLYALRNEPVESFESCYDTISLDRTMYNISRSILEDFSCPIALILSRPLQHVQTASSEIDHPLDLSVLEIFTGVTGTESRNWIEVADILGLDYTKGIIIDTPRLREIVRDNTGITLDGILSLSVPQIIAYYILLNDSLYVYEHYKPMFNNILSTYDFSSKELFEASGYSLTKKTTITEVHQWLLTTIISRYDVYNITSLIGYSEEFLNDSDLAALPSFQWYVIIEAVIQQSFKQVIQAFSYNLTTKADSISISSQPDGFRTINTDIKSAFDYAYIARVSSCLFKKNVSSFGSNNFKEYQRFYNNTLAKTMMKKIVFEMETLESLLSERNTTLDEIESVLLLETVQTETGFELFEIVCLYESSVRSPLISGITWGDIRKTKLCYSVTNFTLLEVVTAVNDARTVNCGKVNCSSSPCHANGDCLEKGSGFECVCKSGFTGDGHTFCEDINECTQNSSCHSHATCQNNFGSYQCLCKTGFVGNGFSCSDQNECTSSDACHSDATCQNTIGSYTCSCKTGFTGNGKSECTAVNSGSSNPSSSDSNLGVIVGVVVAAVVVIVTVILIVGCLLYRRKPSGGKRPDVGNVQNPAYEGDKQPKRRLPRVPYSDGGYEEPSDYAQLDSSKRVPMDANYQSLRHKNKRSSYDSSGDYAELERENENENDQRYKKPGYGSPSIAESYVTVMDGPRNEVSKESIYEELP